MSQMNKLDQRQQLMVVTMEECGELVQACSKILRRQELYADTKYVQNLKDEIGDVYTMLKLMVEHDVVSWDELEKRNDHKREKLKNGATSLNKKDIEKKKMMDDFELAIAKSMTKTNLDPLGSLQFYSNLHLLFTTTILKISTQ